MHTSRYRGPSAPPYRRTIAPRVREHHSRHCALSTRTSRRCSCRPAYVACIRHNGRSLERTFPTLTEAVEWAESRRDAIRRGETPVLVVREQAPPLRDLAVSFLHRARRGEALTRSRQRYAQNTLDGYEVALRLRVLPHTDPRTGQMLGDTASDGIDARALQSLVDSVTVRDSPACARTASAAVTAVLRDGYLRGITDQLPPRALLPPPPNGRKRALTLVEADRLLAAAYADDSVRKRSLLGPLVALLLGTGCRISEATGLHWGPDGLDLNADSPVMHVRRESTKTDAGARSIPLDADTTLTMRRHRLATGRPEDGVRVFTGRGGRHLDRSGAIRSGLVRVAEAAGLPEVSAHVLRHTHATWLASAGVPAPVAAARLGHADGGALFMRVYAHPGTTEAEMALDALVEYRAATARR